MSSNSEFNTGNLVIREMNGTYIAWFANGNQYLKLEEPACFVLKNIEEKVAHEIIAKRCSKRYQNTLEESRKFVKEIVAIIDSIMQTPVQKKLAISYDQQLNQKLFIPFSIHYYRIRGKNICFQFETPLHEHYLHPLLHHLEDNTTTDASVLFELFNNDEQIILRTDNKIIGSWKNDETHLLLGAASLQILNIVYKKTDADWMAVIHGSAVTNGKKTIVFTAGPGSGKSTMAALLKQKGFDLVSDDFIPIEKETLHVFPFPAAMSVKEGATELLSKFYPSLKSQEEPVVSRTNKLVRYLPVEGKGLPTPVKEIIFIKYNPTIDFEMERIPYDEALKTVLDETWTYPSAENAIRFLNWYKEIACYQLTYSNNEKALQSITELFEQ